MATTESLIFDADRVQEEQEEELKQEEDERQQELKDLLANAFDDIEADETCSFASDDSHDSGRHSDEICQQTRWTSNKIDYHASTPVSECRAPPLITPVIQRKYNASPSTYTAPHQSYNTRQGTDTLYQEPDVSSAACEGNVTQKVDAAVSSPHYQSFSGQQQVGDKYNGSYPSSLSSSDTHQRHGSVQHSPLYPGCNGSNERHLTGSSDAENTVFIDSGEKKSSAEILQDRYFQEGAGAKNTQLSILYQAKSRQLQELQEKYELFQLESTKELRLLRHEVALLQGSKQGCEASLKHTQSMLSQNKEARFELQKKLDEVQEENRKLGSECAELKEQLVSAEGSIESLNAQIFSLGSSDTIERMREQHESIVNSLRKEGENSKHELNQQIASLQLRLHSQKEEVDSATLLLKSDMEAIAKERVDHAETVNRLTQSLKESQRQIQDLLDESRGAELSKLKIQLQQCTASKELTEQLSTSLQREVKELKEELLLYETSQATHNIFSPPPQDHDAYDDTLAELGIKSVPITASCKLRSTKTDAKADDTAQVLRQELKKYMGLVKEKREEIASLRAEAGQRQQEEMRSRTEISVLQERLEKCQVQLKEAGIELNLYKSAAGEGRSLTEVKLTRQMESLGNDKAILQDEVKCLTERLELVASNEAKLGEINAELNCKIGEMIEDFDRDKKAALERCQETLQSHNETVKDMMRAELETEYEMKVQRLDSRYKAELSNAKSSCAALSEELRQVKELYVQVCSEKRHDEESMGLAVLEDTRLVEDRNHLKLQQEKMALLQQSVSELEGANAGLVGEKETLNVMVEQLRQQLATNIDKAVPDKEKEDSSGKSSGLSACRELFSSGSSRSQSLHSSSSSGGIDLQGQLQAAKSELANVREELQKAQAGLETSRNTLEETQKSLAEAERKLATSVQEVKKRESELQQLKVIIADLRGDNQKLDKLLSAERVQLSLARDDAVTLQTQLSDYQSQLGTDSKEADRLNKIVATLEGCQKSLAKTRMDLEAEATAHSTTKAELAKVTDLLACETESHSQVKEKLSLAISDLQKERRAHLQTKSEVDKKGSLLQAEINNHNRSKIELSKLRAESAEMEVNSKELVPKNDLQKVETSLEAERSLLEKARKTIEELERNIASEKAASGLIQTDLDKTSAALQSARVDHSETKKKFAALKEELVRVQGEKAYFATVQSELDDERQASETLKHTIEELEKCVSQMKPQLLEAQAEIDKVKVALQAEIAAHSEIKAEHGRLQNNLAECEAKCEQMVERSLLATAQLELEAERNAHRQTQESLDKLKSDGESERSFQTMTRATLTNVQQQLQLERAEHQQTQGELAQLEEALQVEQTSHNATRIAVVTKETELSSERETQAELRRSLEKVRATCTEQETELELLRTNRRKDRELIDQMKTHRQQGKSQLESLKSTHAKSVSELNEARAKLIKRESELTQKRAANSRLLKELERLTESHREEKERLVQQHSDSLKRAVDEAEERWREMSSPAPDVVAENKYLKEKLNTLELEVENCEKLLSQADEHFEKQLSKMRVQMQEEYTVQIEKLTSISTDTKNLLKSERAQQVAVKESLEKQADDLRIQVAALTQRGEDLENKCKDYQSCAEDLRRNLKSVFGQSDSLKAANKKLQVELKKMAAGSEARVELLSKQLENKVKELRNGEHEHSLTVQSLKQKLVSLRNEQMSYKMAQQVAKGVESTSCACQTVPIEPTGKHQYDVAIRSIRVEVMNYVEETNRNAAKLIRCEIHKAKQATARQLRNYYVKCFKQSLQDRRSSYTEKLNKLERTLDDAVAAAVTPTHIDTDSILSAPPEQLFSGGFRCSVHTDTCHDHSLAELYSRGPTPVVTDRSFRYSGRRSGRQQDVTPTPEDISDRDTPVVTDTESRYSYVPLRNLAISSSFGADRVNTPTTSLCNTDSSDIIRELGLDNTETSPPRWYNPPPEKLTPSPDRQPSSDGRLQNKLLKTRALVAKE